MDGDTLDAIRAQLPGWIGLAPLLIWAPAAWLVARWTGDLAAAIAIRPYRRLPAGAHWSERARLAYPARVATAFFSLLTMGLLGVLAARAGGELALAPPPLAFAGVAACAWLGASTARTRLARELGHGPTRLGELTRDDLVPMILLVPHVLLPLAFTPLVRAPLGLEDAAAVAVLVACFVWIARGGVLAGLGWLGLTEPAPDKLVRAIAEAARTLGVPAPPVTVVRWGAANAFAFPLRGLLAFSSRCVEVLDESELAAVAAHEIGHLTEPRGVRWLRGAMLLVLLPLAGVAAAWDLAGPLGALAPMLVVLVLAVLFRSVAARMEKRADEVAHTAVSPARYARALERIHEANALPAVLSNRTVHPHLYDRVLAAGVTPDYPRPAPPSSRRTEAAILVPIFWLVFASVVLAGLPELLTIPALHDRRASDLVIALEPGPGPLLRRALFEEAHGRPDGVLAFARAAASLAPEQHESVALAAMALARQGRCDESQAMLADAAARASDAYEDPWIVSAQASLAACAPTSRPAVWPAR